MKRVTSHRRYQWARARFLNASTDTVCVLGDRRAVDAALLVQHEANEDWQAAQLAKFSPHELEAEDMERVRRMDAAIAAEARR